MALRFKSYMRYILDNRYRNSEFICDDRGVSENIQKIRSMTDEEFERHIAELKKSETKKE